MQTSSQPAGQTSGMRDHMRSVAPGLGAGSTPPAPARPSRGWPSASRTALAILKGAEIIILVLFTAALVGGVFLWGAALRPAELKPAGARG